MPPNHGRIPGEGDLLRRIERAAGSRSRSRRDSGIRLGIGDDAALWKPRAGFETLLTTDWFLEGTHFLRKLHPPDSVGWKCLARAASDVAAMGGEPRCFLLSLALPENATGTWLDEFLRGLARAARRLRCQLAGGDTTKKDTIAINVTVVGEARSGRVVRRSGARDGDYIYVSGTLGEAACGFELLKRSKPRNAKRNLALRRHLYPEPRLALGKWLAEKCIATAMIDISDGLSTDMLRLCEASRLGALLDAADFPCHKGPHGRRRSPASSTLLKMALNGGDDYELLFTAPRNALLPREFRGLRISPIGIMTSGPNVVISEPNAPLSKYYVLTPGGWDPFRK